MDKDKLFHDKSREILTRTFKEIISFCEDNNLTYWATGGTMLGAIRHHGYIPWDDDVDIRMPWSDYCKLLDLYHSKGNPKYKIVSFKNRGYYYAHSKFVDSETTLWEYWSRPFVSGVFVDIIPYFLSNDNEKEIEIKYEKYSDAYKKYVRTTYYYDLYSLYNSLIRGEFKMIFGFLRSKLFYRNAENYYKEYVNQLTSLNCDDGDKYVLYIAGDSSIMKKKWSIMNREWLDRQIEVPFEDFKVKIPVGYDHFLKFFYGEYMKLPPEDKRYSIHPVIYENLKEGLSIEEVKQRLKLGEYKVY